NPGHEPPLFVALPEVVAEVVVTVRGPDEEGPYQGLDVHRIAGDERSAAPRRRPSEVNRGEEQAPLAQGVVPVAVNVDAARRGPQVVGRDEGPAGAGGYPEAGAPAVAGLMEDPAAGDVGAL